jgi:hypothetical protein
LAVDQTKHDALLRILVEAEALRAVAGQNNYTRVVALLDGVIEEAREALRAGCGDDALARAADRLAVAGLGMGKKH